MQNDQIPDNFNITESIYYEFPNKLKHFIQHPFKTYVLRVLPIVSPDVLERLTEEQIIMILNDFLNKWSIYLIILLNFLITMRSY